ncbi:hypothetical protein AAF712_009140 [Marasmius tenuissimus]|uniref:Glycoside hydrolase family 76 protein n=1 Tax=Marasmius tenuissimus TaxID=585030 RepID=A0ABR2ZRQ3_9AGAR
MPPAPILLAVTLCTLFDSIVAQEIPPTPTGWLKPSILIPPLARKTLAKDALSKALEIFDGASGQYQGSNYQYTGVLYSQMAELDLATGNIEFKNSLSGFFPKAEELKPGFVDEKLVSRLNFGVLYGLAAMQAHAAYEDKTYISYAETAWGSMNEYTLSDRDVEAGRSPTKSLVLAKGCSGASLAGGSFASTDGKDDRLNGQTTGLVRNATDLEPFYVLTCLSDFLTRLFLILSSMLAKATGNQTYLAAAIQSFEFLQSQLRDQTGLIVDSLSSVTCQEAGDLIPYNTGLMIEGLSVLVSIEPNNETLFQAYATLHFVIDAVKASILTFEWNGSNGIMTHGDWYTVHALTTLYKQNASSSELQRLMKDYLSYNAVLDFTTINGTNVYGTSYIGPPGNELEPIAQAAILPVLISGIVLGDAPVTSTASPTGSTPSPTGTPVSSNKGKQHSAIIGGAVGGTLLFLLLAGVGLWVLKGRLRKGRTDVSGENPSVTPYPIGYSVETKRTRDPLNPLKRQQTIAEIHHSPKAAVSGQNDIRLSEQLVRALEAQYRRENNVPPPDYRSNLGRPRKK